MPQSQNILTLKTRAAIFLVLTINDGGEAAVRDALADAPALGRSVASRDPDTTMSTIVSIGSDAWDRLFAGARPKSLRPFATYEGDVHTAPSTPGDILVHIKSDRADLCFESALLFTRAFGDAVTVVDETHGFRYFDVRDLIGFVDGTENPTGQDAVKTITVGDEDPAFAGGSYVAIQRYVHDLDAWNALTTGDQENAIGRTKFDNVEMPDDIKPINAHIALNVVENADGVQIDVVRDNMPYGDASGAGECGTFYIAYSSGPDVTEEMLRKMFIGDPPGNYDRLLDFTTAITGAQFYTPTEDFFDDLPPAPEPAGADERGDVGTEAAEPEVIRSPTPNPDGSLGIGSLH